MEKEFIPYEQALALKKLHFDELSFGHYIFGKTMTLLITDSVLYNNSELQNEGVSTPLYQQAFKWFREKYNLFPEIKVEDNVKLGEQKYYWIIKGSYKTSNSNCWIRSIADSENKEYKTYEEAELACLKKLIEIAQNNKNRC